MGVINDDVNILINVSINIVNHSNVSNSEKFNSEVIDSLRPQGELTKDMKDWERVVLMSLNNMNRKEKDDRKTSYVKYKLCKRDIYGLALVDTRNLVRGTLVSSEFWDTIGGKIIEKSDARVSTAEKGGKGLKVLGKGEQMRFYLDGLDQIFEVEPIVIEGLIHAVNFGIEFFRQQEVSISCTDKEVKLVTGSEGKERLTRLCSATGMPFPFMNRGRRVDKAEKKYVQVIPAVWRAERRQKEVSSVNNISEVTEKKLWAGEKVIIPAGKARLVKVRTEGDWKGQGFVESIPLEEQEAGRKLILPENAYNLSGSVQAVYMENHAEECVEVCAGQRLGTIQSLCIDEEAWL